MSSSEVAQLKAENAELKERIKYLEDRAFIDHLTGAYNRHAFEPELEKSLRLVRGEIRENRAGVEPLTQISLIMLDLDHFKQVNDTFGHLVGDEVLRKVSLFLIGSVRDTDMVARYGGEEFVILLRNADSTFAGKKAEELRAGIEQIVFGAQAGLKVTASFGVVSSESSANAIELKKIADEMLYKAKNAGRNRVEVYK